MSVEVAAETPDCLCLVLSPVSDGLAGRLASRAAADPVFHARLRSAPSAAIEEELGARLPEGVRIRVLEERDDYWPIVLPAGPLGDPLGPELPALALAAVGGGRTDRPGVSAAYADSRPGTESSPRTREC